MRRVLTGMLTVLLSLTACAHERDGGGAASKPPSVVTPATITSSYSYAFPITPPPPTPPRASRTRPPVHHVASSRRAMWDRLVYGCEAPERGYRYGAPGVGIDPGYPFEGGPNFTHGTWVAHGGREFAEHAWDATPEEQIIVAERVLEDQGVGSWPNCWRKAGLTRR